MNRELPASMAFLIAGIDALPADFSGGALPHRAGSAPHVKER